MARYREAPFGFDCPYQNRCPHLEGLSTSWTFTQYQESFLVERKYWIMRDDYEAEVDGLRADIRELEKENAELKAQLKALHQRQFKAGKKRSPDHQPSDSADFGPKLPPISEVSYHLFRAKVTTHFGNKLPPVSGQSYRPFRK